MKLVWVLGLVVGLVVFAGYLIYTRQNLPSFTPQPTNKNALKSNEVVNQVNLQFEVDGAKVDLSQVMQGCIGGLDCIPSIDEPQFESLQSADSWLGPQDRVFVFERNGIERIYPQRILNWHEIVNDWYGEDPIVVTFCPLCGSALAFERRVNGTITEFGVSGKLHNNDLIMYDRLEGSGWQQITGEAIFGPAARRDEELKPLFLVILPWQEAKAKYPQAQVLSRDTGFSRDYDQYPYGTYEEDGRILFGTSENQRLPSKAWVYGIEVEDQAMAIPEEVIKANQALTVTAGDTPVTVSNQAGVITFQNLDTGEDIIATRLFWFAWAAFHPDTTLYQPSAN